MRDLRRVLTLAAAALLPALGLFCLIIFAIGSRLAVFVYGEQYAGAGMILSVLSLSVLANGMGTLVGNGLWAIDQPCANFFADVCCLVVTLASAVVLVSAMGTLGAAIALLAGTSVAAVVCSATLWWALSQFDGANETILVPSELS